MHLLKKYIYIALIFIPLLLIYIQSCGEDNLQNPGQHFSATGLFIQPEGSSDTLVYYHNGSFTDGKDSLFVNAGDTTSNLQIIFLDAARNVISPPLSSEYSLGLDIANLNIAKTLITQRWDFRLVGITSGQTTLIIKVTHGTHADFTSMPVRIRVIP
jgi:hypothetical protein